MEILTCFDTMFVILKHGSSAVKVMDQELEHPQIKSTNWLFMWTLDDSNTNENPMLDNWIVAITKSSLEVT